MELYPANPTPCQFGASKSLPGAIRLGGSAKIGALISEREYRKDLSRKGTRYTIAVETDTLHRLTLFASQGESSGTYEAASSQRPDPFALPGYLGEDLVSSAKELLKEPRASSGPE